MNVRIITDSTADLLPEHRKQVEVVPLTVIFGQEEFLDGVTITHREFYEKLTGSAALPSTSQATPDSFARVFRRIQRDGDSAVVLTLSSKLSGTYQSAMIAAGDFENIHVVDTGSVTIGSGILVQRALELVSSGMDGASVARQLEQEKQDIRVVAMVDTLEYLKKGGRISGAVALAGTLLNIKPILCVADGEITIPAKARGTKQGYDLLDREIAKAQGVDFDRPVLLGYTGLSEEQLDAYRQSSPLWSRNSANHTMVGSIIGTHAGPGAIAAAFFKKD